MFSDSQHLLERSCAAVSNIGLLLTVLTEYKLFRGFKILLWTRLTFLQTWSSKP